MINTQVLEFLKNNRVSVLATQLEDGSPHTAALHYSYTDDPFVFYFSTDSESRKCQQLIKTGKSKASVTIGVSEEEWITFQLEGELEIIKSSQEIDKAKLVHYTKNPGSRKFEAIPTTVFLKLTPTWYRYTDFNTSPVTHVEG